MIKMTKRTITRLKQAKKVNQKKQKQQQKLCKSDKNNLLMYSISQIDVTCFNKMILLGADVNKKQTYYCQRVKPIELILYEAAHGLYNKLFAVIDVAKFLLLR